MKSEPSNETIRLAEEYLLKLRDAGGEMEGFTEKDYLAKLPEDQHDHFKNITDFVVLQAEGNDESMVVEDEFQ
jgi:hypothetical protein